MAEARWAQVKALFQAAVERPALERAAFLAAAAGDDGALRREVESLLRNDDSDPPLPELLQSQDATVRGASLRASGASSEGETRTQTTSEIRGSIGPYQVVGLLGTGGMGEVFRARDSKLHRDVALKLLPRAFELDPDRLTRFRREAQVLAALNHPHVAAIYGLEESDGRQSLVLELVEGATLAERIAHGPLAVAEALALARQFASALEAAHEKGIVHRDLKPANIKVTSEGVLKVLDFGLAKMANAERAVVEAAHSPRSDAVTRVGAVLGTAAYMSPEQARGLDVDARTDIWAFGCILFEMLSGCKAFGADEEADSTDKVLAREPNWTALPARTPKQVRELLWRCLENDPANRLQTIEEARQLIERLLIGRRLSPAVALASAAVAVLALSAAMYLWSRPPQSTSMADWVPLTNLDAVSHPALSRDGRMLAFVRGAASLWVPGPLYVKRLPDGEPVPLAQDALPKHSPVFSPDGSRIAFSVRNDTWEVATLGGTPRHWLTNASGLAWIDSENLLFSEIKTGNHRAIVRSTGGFGQRDDVYVPVHQTGVAHKSYPSPDVNWVLVVEMDEGIWQPCRLVPIAGGTSQPVGPKGRCTAAAWSPNGRWMYFSADAGDGFHIWRQRFPAGEPEQVTAGATQEEGLAIAPDGRSLITAVSLGQRSVWVHDGSGDRQISLAGYAYFPRLSADAQKVCFRVTRGDSTGQSPSELWVADLRSGTTQRLFPGELVTGYDLSNDDRVVAAVQDGNGRTRVWLTSLDARQPPHPVPGAEGDQPRFGRQGEIIFRVPGVGLHRTSEDGSRRERVSGPVGNAIGSASPHGIWLSGVTEGVMSLHSTGGDAPIPTLQVPASRMLWSTDGNHAYISIQYGPPSAFGVGRTYVLPLRNGSVLPDVPPGGIRSEEELASMPGVTMIPHGDVALGASPLVYTYSRVTTTRNLYRIPLH